MHYVRLSDLLHRKSRKRYHGPYVVPKLGRREPSIKPLQEDVRIFCRQVQAHLA